MIAWLFALPLALLATGVLAWKKRRDPRWRPLLPGLVGTVVGTVASLATYLWVFERESCNGRGDVACMLNQNQGVLTFMAIVLTVSGLWGATLQRRAAERAAKRAAAARARLALQAAADELHHNLIHVALAYDEDHDLISRPQINAHAVRHLLDPEVRLAIHPQVSQGADGVVRNLDAMAAASGEDADAYERRLQDFTSRSMKLLLHLQQWHPAAVASVLRRPGMQDFIRLAGGPVAGTFNTEEPPSYMHEIRNQELPILSWFDDGDLEGVEVFPQFQRFRDMNHPPH